MALPELSTAQTPTHRQAHRTWVDAAAYFDLDGDGTTDNSTELVAARDSLGQGSKIILPPWELAYATSFAPAHGQSWVGAGRGNRSNRWGTRLKYTGTGIAWDLTSRSHTRLEDLEIRCTSTSVTAGLKLTDPSDSHKFDNVFFYGPAIGSGIGTLFTGQTGCCCHNKFSHCSWTDWNDLLRISGFANGNEFVDGFGGNCSTGINFTKYGADTTAGTDNTFMRFELDGGTTKGITLADTAHRNAFIKVQCDGVTNGYSVAASVVDTMFILCAIALGTYSDASTSTMYMGCSGAVDGIRRGLASGSFVPLNAIKVGTVGFTAVPDGISVHGEVRGEDVVRAGYGATAGATIGLVGPSSKEGLTLAADVNLYRDAANRLRTDDLFVASSLGVGNSAAATTPGSVVKKIQVFDESGASLGYIPVYSAIT